MKKPRRIYILAFVVALAAGFAARSLWFYPAVGKYDTPDVPESTPRPVERLSGEYDVVADLDAAGQTVVIDYGHGNGFSPDELTLFTGRMTSSGAQVEYVEDEFDLTIQLHTADSLIVIAPAYSFSPEEVQAIHEFVNKGGRLVLIGDPTRQFDVDGLNSLAGEFGVIYQDDYIYSLTNNDGNFRNVILTDFTEELPITEGLDEIIFQTAYSLRTAEEYGVIFGDEEVYSSDNELPGGVIAAALTGGGQVLALPDMTFLTSPYNTFGDNDVLTDNIVSFALGGQRSFGLRDFPYFFESETAIVYEDAVTLNNTFADMVQLRGRLTDDSIPASLAEEYDEENAFIYLALYDQASEDVLDLLENDGVTLSDDPLSEDGEAPLSNGSIVVEDVARLERGGTALLHLVQPGEDGSAYRLVILASEEEDLSAGINLLMSGSLPDCLITPQTAVCKTGEVSIGEEEEPFFPSVEGETARVLIVSDDTGLATESGQTSAFAIFDALGVYGYDVTYHSILEDGMPEVFDLFSADVVFWSAGDFCCLAPNEEGAAVLMEYLDSGGRLFIDGLFIATDWAGDSFLTDYLGAEYDGYADQVDIEPAGTGHPLALGFSGTIPFVETDVIPQPDVIFPSEGSEVVFVRGPESDRAGDPALIAYERDGRRVAYSAFPIYLLNQGDLDLLVLNAVEWLAAQGGF